MEYKPGYSESFRIESYFSRISDRVKDSFYGTDNTDTGSSERDQYGFRKEKRGGYSSGGGAPSVEIPVQSSDSFRISFSGD